MRKIIGRQIDDGPGEYLVQCPVCGDMIDMRDMAEVIDRDCGPAPAMPHHGGQHGA